MVSCLASTFWKTLKNPPANLWGKAAFSPKNKGFWETLPHKGLSEALGRHQLTGTSLPPDRWSSFPCQQAAEGSQDFACIPHGRASLGQKGSNVHALHSWRAKWWTVDRRAIKCLSSTYKSLCFSLSNFLFGRINVLFAYLPKSVLAPVQTPAWWQAVVWTLDARICADSSFHTFRVKPPTAGQERKLFPHHRQPLQ